MKENAKLKSAKRVNKKPITPKFNFNFFIKNIVKQHPIRHFNEDEGLLCSLNEHNNSIQIETSPQGTQEEIYEKPPFIELPMKEDISQLEKKQKFEVKIQNVNELAEEKSDYSFQSSFQEMEQVNKESFLIPNSFSFKRFKRKQALKKDIKKHNLKKFFIKKFNLDQEKQHQCKICGKKFRNPTALGGHMSRSHPNMSVEYKIRCNRMLLYQGEKDRKRFIQKSCKQIFY